MRKQQNTIRVQDGLLRVDYDSEILALIEKALGDLRSERHKVLKNAVNASVKSVRPDLISKAQEEYTIKKSALNKATSVQKATVSNPTATILVKGGALEIREYKATAPKSGAKARILASGTLKRIQSERGSRAKAFLATFSSGHTAIVQRQDGEEYRRDKAKRRAKYGAHADMTRLKKLLSISAPKAIGGSRVIEAMGPSIYATLMENIQKEIWRVTGK